MAMMLQCCMGVKYSGSGEKRKKRIEHEYAIAGWALCVMPEVRDDV
jgi:hypothetical protein